MWTNQLYKGSDGNWLARSYAMLDDNKRLKVITTKVQGWDIRTAAYVFIVDGDCETHRIFTDFYVLVTRNKVRATESAVKRQHEEVMENAGDLIAQAMKFYRSEAA